MSFVKKIAFDPGYSQMLGNQIFDSHSKFAKSMGGLPVADRYEGLKNFLSGKGIEINTYDLYKKGDKIDLWIMMEPSPQKYFLMLKRGICPKKVLFFILEPDIVNPWAWKYLKLYMPFHKAFLSWSSDLVKRYPGKFVELKVPIPFDKSKYPHYKEKIKKNLCVLMQSNKFSNIKGELYSLRREIVRFYEKRGDGLLDLYGLGWNTENTRHLGKSKPLYTTLYKGFAEDKWETFSEYWFAFCIQNSIPSGDFEYDPFMAMATGTVPIYLPPPNADKYVPKDTYINYNDFENLEELTKYLMSLKKTPEYEKYRESGWKYINSARYRPFTVEEFSEKVYEGIIKATS
ncbi:hypothetical protein A3D55_00390 [Candidatus Jorgensenbacteria bacterium RIFCSPHIGHO2_02_FULL_45_20]|uniref:Fucosyltransferase C-terminal domain-containing protein n=1 Tax=Candidatus Jorgensenbacteria bacterium RIFCSPHIGHO2_02_FULL_45_20 TaxID=1798470 RepID=A0A1F6BNF7_9BACT|nr:MAG: hypothetical protein A3D55_00390 [Candidatus Jorgensenbacteria bacterium RIFCSPHIGHO2_02_FULL_45_20]